MTLAKEYSFTAPVVSRGIRDSNATLEFNWKLPGSKYNFILYERDPEKVAMWNAGDLVDATIAQSNLKGGKDGRYATDYFYDLVHMEAAAPESYRNPAIPQSTHARPNQAPRNPVPDAAPKEEPEPVARPTAREEPPPVPQALGACQNHAMAFIESGTIQVPEGRNPLNFLWELRDRIYRNVNQQPYQQAHFCYHHEAPRIQNPRSLNWAHQLADKTWCVEAQDAATAVAGPGPDVEATGGSGGA